MEPTNDAPSERLPLRPATIEEFVRAPVGSYVAGATWLYFYPNEQFSGYFAWGRPGPEDFDALARILPATHTTETVPHPLLLDLRALDSLDAPVFERCVRYTIQNWAAFHHAVTKLALVRPSGLAGALAAGFFLVTPAYSPVQTFDDPNDALAWIDRTDEKALLEEVAALVAEIRSGHGVIGDLRALLTHEPLLDVDSAAARLHLSPRTLQRRLQDAGTSLTTLSLTARVVEAKRRLLETNQSVTEIAFAIGCGSLQHFSTLFRKATGLAPSEWRAKHKT